MLAAQLSAPKSQRWGKTILGVWDCFPASLEGKIREGGCKNRNKGGCKRLFLSALKSQRFLRFAIAMPIADPRL